VPASDGARVRTVVFACVHNAGRSQMAAGFFNALADPTRAKALSAGTEPAAAVHPQVLAAMREVGIDLAHVKPTLLTEKLVAGAERLFTMGCGEACPHVPGVRIEEWPFPDPKEQSLEQVRKIRDEIRGRVEAFLESEGLSARRDRPD
jgi:arsenate reductase (thioredoxin)